MDKTPIVMQEVDPEVIERFEVTRAFAKAEAKTEKLANRIWEFTCPRWR
jgi:hypothetical protein